MESVTLNFVAHCIICVTINTVYNIRLIHLKYDIAIILSIMMFGCLGQTHIALLEQLISDPQNIMMRGYQPSTNERKPQQVVDSVSIDSA